MRYIDRINSPEDLKQIDRYALPELCKEIRGFLVKSVSKTGGHLASNLGVVELTVALHYALNSPEDKILWDVGHQAYVHKILTGRKNKFDTLRQLNGLSGFPKKNESSHDFFDTGHSSTSISSALGLALSRDLSGEKYKVAAIIGDGSMTGGLSFEAINNAGRGGTDLMVILNDNQMSISKNVGAMSRHLNDIRTSPNYIGVKKDIRKILNSIPVVGESLGRFAEKTKNSVKYALVPGILFEEMGFKYIGPIDGHNVEELINVINRAKKMKGPVFLHVYTKKGKGYKMSENDPCVFHGIDKFDIKTGKVLKTKVYDTYSDVLGKTLCKLARDDEKIVAVTAAMPEGTGLSLFQEEFPKRFFDVGIAEAHAVTFSAAMAENGFKPVFAVYSTFLQRGYDQLLHDVCLMNSNVVFAIDRAGVVGADGETHQGLFDISFLSAMPNMVIMAPKNKAEFRKMIKFAVNHKGPVSVRYPKGSASMLLYDNVSEVKLGKSEVIFEGKEIALIALGSMMEEAFKVYKLLKEKGYNPLLINARFAKPIDKEMIEKIKGFQHVFTFEENVITGGFGSNLFTQANQMGIHISNYHIFAFPDEFIPQGTREEIFDIYGLSSEKITETILEKIEDGNRNA